MDKQEERLLNPNHHLLYVAQAKLEYLGQKEDDLLAARIANELDTWLSAHENKGF